LRVATAAREGGRRNGTLIRTHRPLGIISADAKKWVFGHDATTLGGNSGSPVLAWKNGGFGFGLHFPGTVTASNYAHATAKCVDQFKALGIEPTIPT
jgi:V8-like Glu-specific endopeptidase